MAISNVLITLAPIELLPQEHDGEAGAVVDFFGIVRAQENERVITGIEYEVNMPMAEYQLNLIAKKGAADFGLTRIFITHRIGFVKVGEASLLLRVESGHRSAAFSASVWIIDELKKKVPIWKRPVFESKVTALPAELSLRA